MSCAGALDRTGVLCRSEQDTKIQLGFKLMLEVLTPFQASELLVSLFPVQCDCSMLLHALLKAPSTS